MDMRHEDIDMSMSKTEEIITMPIEKFFADVRKPYKNRIINCLAMKEIDQVCDLLFCIGNDRLLAVPNLGKKSRKIILEKLKEHNLSPRITVYDQELPMEEEQKEIESYQAIQSYVAKIVDQTFYIELSDKQRRVLEVNTFAEAKALLDKNLDSSKLPFLVYCYVDDVYKYSIKEIDGNICVNIKTHNDLMSKLAARIDFAIEFFNRFSRKICHRTEDTGIDELAKL